MFRFTMRDMLWLTLTVAICLSWWTHYRFMERRHLQEKNAILDDAAVLHELTNHVGTSE
jgi:hypothetical protein